MADKDIQNTHQKVEILTVAQGFLMQTMFNQIPIRVAIAALKLTARMMEKSLPVLEKAKTDGKSLEQALELALAASREGFNEELDFIINDNQ